MGAIFDAIQEKLQTAFEPSRLEIVDDSARHSGHSGAREGGESHFNVTVVSAAFEGQGRVQRQRAVNDLLRAELAGPVHALSIRALTPSEAAAD